ncbi:MAG: hypothetical protein M3Z31_11125 [Pseudomonadota bacterium]|nr:hypothetical protein [Pseudomonadota bacterium]
MPASPPALRRVVLASALVVALVLAASLRAPYAGAQPAGGSAPTARSSAAAIAPDAPGDVTAAPRAPESKEDVERDSDQHAIVVDKGGKRVRVLGLGADREYKSVDDFIRAEPDLAGMVVAVVAIMFLSPVLLVALVIGYRFRKARLLNETMLKLAERGVVPTPEAMQALSAGQLPPTLTEPGMRASPNMPSLIDQARQVRMKAVSADLRKGALLGALGLAFTVHEWIEEGAPGAVGLILLFIGIAYGALWYYETRQFATASTSTTGPGV